MKKLQCELCGGTLLMESTGDYAACENCGMRYKKEDVKKIFELSGPVQIQDSATLENILIKAYSELSLKEYDNAYETFKKALEIDSNSIPVLMGLVALKGHQYYTRLKALAPEISEDEIRMLSSLDNCAIFIETYYMLGDRGRALYIVKNMKISEPKIGGKYFIEHIIKDDDSEFFQELFKSDYTCSLDFCDPMIIYKNGSKSIKSLLEDKFNMLKKLPINLKKLVNLANCGSELYLKAIIDDIVSAEINIELKKPIIIQLLYQCCYFDNIKLFRVLSGEIKNKGVINHPLSLDGYKGRIRIAPLSVAFDRNSKQVMQGLVAMGVPMPEFNGDEFRGFFGYKFSDCENVDLDYKSDELLYLYSLYGTTRLHVACKGLSNWFAKCATTKDWYPVVDHIISLLEDKEDPNKLDANGVKPCQYLSSQLKDFLWESGKIYSQFAKLYTQLLDTHSSL